jgi:hypothetical protein
MKEVFYNLRRKLDKNFAADTCVGDFNEKVPATGHCAAVAIVVQQLFGGEFRSVMIGNYSHWFNRIEGTDVDLTGDQFGRPAVQIGPNLYPESNYRDPSHLNENTISRAELLAKRLGFSLGRFRNEAPATA